MGEVGEGVKAGDGRTRVVRETEEKEEEEARSSNAHAADGARDGAASAAVGVVEARQPDNLGYAAPAGGGCGAVVEGRLPGGNHRVRVSRGKAMFRPPGATVRKPFNWKHVGESLFT